MGRDGEGGLHFFGVDQAAVEEETAVGVEGGGSSRG
jgi:hypothetical protein